jgi:predicted enzyme related to lactoylglutathione lyase
MAKFFAGQTTWSSDLNNLLPFYRDLLGLKVRLETPEFVVFGDAGSAAFCLGTHSEVKGKNPDPARHMSGFEVSDIQADVKRLKDAGVEIVEEPTRQGESDFWIATCKDPEGNYVQLFQGTP